MTREVRKLLRDHKSPVPQLPIQVQTEQEAYTARYLGKKTKHKAMTGKFEITTHRLISQTHSCRSRTEETDRFKSIINHLLIQLFQS